MIELESRLDSALFFAEEDPEERARRRKAWIVGGSALGGAALLGAVGGRYGGAIARGTGRGIAKGAGAIGGLAKRAGVGSWEGVKKIPGAIAGGARGAWNATKNYGGELVEATKKGYRGAAGQPINASAILEPQMIYFDSVSRAEARQMRRDERAERRADRKILNQGALLLGAPRTDSTFQRVMSMGIRPGTDRIAAKPYRLAGMSRKEAYAALDEQRNEARRRAVEARNQLLADRFRN